MRKLRRKLCPPLTPTTPLKDMLRGYKNGIWIEELDCLIFPEHVTDEEFRGIITKLRNVKKARTDWMADAFEQYLQQRAA